MTINEAAKSWVRSCINEIPTDLVKCFRYQLKEVTIPLKEDEVNIWVDGKTVHGYITDIENGVYTVESNDETKYECEIKDIKEVIYDDKLPIYGIMFSFKDSLNDEWLDDNIQVMSECGFRIFKHSEHGYFFGIDGAGYNFDDEHWLPLYKIRYGGRF